jgi:hypothetical protein
MMFRLRVRLRLLQTSQNLCVSSAFQHLKLFFKIFCFLPLVTYVKSSLFFFVLSGGTMNVGVASIPHARISTRVAKQLGIHCDTTIYLYQNSFGHSYLGKHKVELPIINRYF